MTIPEIIERRGITEVVHYTTNLGLVGILASHKLLSRRRLPQEKYVEHVYNPTCEIRRDAEWFDYVNLSISRINVGLFDIASKKWHSSKDLWWCILAFDPVILTHDGVFFTTTNNMYSGCDRRIGAAGLAALFAPRVHQYLSNWSVRVDGIPDRYPTCRQAEALYPVGVDTKFLRTIYVATDDHSDTACAQCQTLGYDEVSVIIRPEAFA